MLADNRWPTIDVSFLGEIFHVYHTHEKVNTFLKKSDTTFQDYFKLEFFVYSWIVGTSLFWEHGVPKYK